MSLDNETKLFKGQRVKIVAGKHQGNQGIIQLLENEQVEYGKPETRPVVIILLDGSAKMIKVYPHEVSRTLKVR